MQQLHEPNASILVFVPWNFFIKWSLCINPHLLNPFQKLHILQRRNMQKFQTIEHSKKTTLGQNKTICSELQPYSPLKTVEFSTMPILSWTNSIGLVNSIFVFLFFLLTILCTDVKSLSTIKFVVQLSTITRIDALLKTGCPANFIFHQAEKRKSLLQIVEKQNIIRKIGSIQEPRTHGSIFQNPLIGFSMGDPFVDVLDSQDLN